MSKASTLHPLDAPHEAPPPPQVAINASHLAHLHENLSGNGEDGGGGGAGGSGGGAASDLQYRLPVAAQASLRSFDTHHQASNDSRTHTPLDTHSRTHTPRSAHINPRIEVFVPRNKEANVFKEANAFKSPGSLFGGANITGVRGRTKLLGRRNNLDIGVSPALVAPDSYDESLIGDRYEVMCLDEDEEVKTHPASHVPLLPPGYGPNIGSRMHVHEVEGRRASMGSGTIIMTPRLAAAQVLSAVCLVLSSSTTLYLAPPAFLYLYTVHDVM